MRLAHVVDERSEERRMSGLAALLARRKPVGVYHWSSPMRTRDIRHAAEHAGWHCVVLDTIEAADPPGFHDAVAAAWGLSPSYGRTPAALAELLRGPDVPTDRPTLVVWEGWAPLAKSDQPAAREVVGVFADRCAGEPAFAVVLHGPGPDLELVELDRRPSAPA
jgi:Barstar (barnase inhibitor)